jgi:outer membrane protein, heavy metal efflux system
MKTLLLLVAALPLCAQLTLQELERRALEHNPTLAQAQAAVGAAAGRAKQAGLYPNPRVGVVGEEIAGGPVIRGGEVGGGFEQRLVTGGKLKLSRNLAERDRAITAEQANVQRQRVLNTVRALYYQALGDQFRMRVRMNLSNLAKETQRISDELANVGQADQPDQLAAQVEAGRIELELSAAIYQQQATWRQLAAAINDDTLTLQPLADDFEQLPRIDAQQALAAIYQQSPELRAAELGVDKAAVALNRARKEVVPDIVVSGGVRYNRELLDNLFTGAPRPVGREGYFDINIELPLFNRNQGNIAAARAEEESAKLEVTRKKLALRAQLAEAYRDYQTAALRAARYQTELLPKAQRAYELYLDNFRNMAAAYPQALSAQRNLFQLQDAYADALAAAWRRAVQIQGLLISTDD